MVPILFAHQYWFHSARVRNWRPYPVLNGDITNVWIGDWSRQALPRQTLPVYGTSARTYSGVVPKPPPSRTSPNSFRQLSKVSERACGLTEPSVRSGWAPSGPL